MARFKILRPASIAALIQYIWGSKNKTVEPTYHSRTKTYLFERDNIVITNVHFANNKIMINVEEKE